MIHILCGKIDSGKSTRVQEYVRSFKKPQSVNGFATPAHIGGGKKTGHNFVAIESGRFAKPIPFTRLEAFDCSFKWRRFHFNRAAFDVASKMNTDCGLFVMDEIGPLELENKRGFYDVLVRAIDSARDCLIAVRTEMKTPLQNFLGSRKLTFLD